MLHVQRARVLRLRLREAAVPHEAWRVALSVKSWCCLGRHVGGCARF